MYEVLLKIKEKLEGKFGGIKHIFIEDPNVIPTSSMPCIAVDPRSTSIDIADTGRDLFEYTIDIILIMDITRELGKPGNEVVGNKFLTTTMEGMDANNKLKKNTIISIIRENLELEKNLKIGNVSDISYGPEVRQQAVTKEAKITIIVQKFSVR